MSTLYAVPSQDLLPNLLKVLDLIVMNIRKPGTRNFKPVRDAYSYTASERIERTKLGKVFSISKRCVGLINKSLCSHRFEEAAKLLWIISQDTSVFDTFLFKATMFVLENLNSEDQERTMWDLLRETQRLQFLNKKEVLLEYIIYGIRNNVPDVQERAMELIKMTRMKYVKKNDILDPIFEAYCAFLLYAEWCYGNVGDTQLSQAKGSAENAILQFKKIIECPGDWDIFVLNLIEMLHFCDRSDEVEDVLLRYVECNPTSLNAHIYLCLHLHNHSPDSEKLVPHLQKLVKLSPSDERVLLLIQKWSKLEEKFKKCLKLIFFFLDYPSNGKNFQAWEMLSNILIEIKLRNCDEELELTQSYWNSRSKSWHWMHFNPDQVLYLNESDCQLVAIKIDVLSYFDTDHAYIRKAIERFPTLKHLLISPLEEIFPSMSSY